jgi:hypothetical protein
MIINALAIPLIIEMLNRLWNMWLALMVRDFDLSRNRQRIKLEATPSNIIVLSYSLLIIALCIAYF